MRLDLTRTASFRVALFYAALFTLSVFVLFVTIYLATTGFTARQLAGRVERDLMALKTEYQVGGRKSLLAEITDRLANGQGGFYRLEAADGAFLAGNLPPSPRSRGWVDLPSPANGDHIRARGITLADGSYLLAGADATLLDALTERVIQAFLWGSLATILLAALGAALMSTVSLRRLEIIRGSIDDIMAGNLSRRIPLSGGRDEFDRLGGQVNAMLDRIEALMRSLQQVSNDIAHDLKTPMTRLRQRLEMTRRGSPALEDYAAAVEQAIVECDSILEIFNALLRIAQIEAGTRRSGFREVDLSALIETLFVAYEPVAEESGRALSLDAAPGAIVAGDPDLIAQLVSNLLENALKHTPPGTSIAVGLAEAGGILTLSVEDDGPGIPPALHGKVLERFYRVDSSRSTAGSGLGLSLVAAVAQLHDASVTLAERTPGLRVEVTFPGRRGRQTGAAPP